MKLYKYTFYDKIIKEDVYEVKKDVFEKFYIQRVDEITEMKIAEVEEVDTDELTDGYKIENGYPRYDSGWCYLERKSVDYIKNVLIKFYELKIQRAKNSYERNMIKYSETIDLIKGVEYDISEKIQEMKKKREVDKIYIEYLSNIEKEYGIKLEDL